MKKIKLFFDEPSHTYTDDEGNVYTSATQLIGKVEPKYDSEFWAIYRALDQYGHSCIPNTKKRTIKVRDYDGLGEFVEYPLDDLYNGVVKTNWTKERILAEWQTLADVACDWGNKRHNYLEDCVNDFYKGAKPTSTKKYKEYNNELGFKFKIVSVNQLKNSPLAKSHKSIFKLLCDAIKAGYTLYAEKRVYSYEHKVSGTIDIIAVKGKSFYIIDWKTNKDELTFESGYYKKEWIYENGKRIKKVKTDKWVNTNATFLRPLNNVSHCKGNVYTLQLSLYAYICELWGLKFMGSYLCHIRHKEDERGKKTELTPKIYKLKYFKEEIHELMQWQVNKDKQIDPSIRGRVA